MSSDSAFHFPPDVFNAVVDAVPLLVRGKMDVVVFFQGCGVGSSILAPLAQRVRSDPSSVSKYQIAREIVTTLNEQGDQGLGPRRQVLKRITEFDDFGSCYPDNQLKAKGAVATLAQLINKKDSFTRMDQAREAEERKTREAARIQAEEVAAKR